MNVLSLFDGISCARVALDRAGIEVKNYYASEIDKNAIRVSAKNYPDIVRVGDVREVKEMPEHIDLLIGGSPCQDLSIAKKGRQGLKGNRSSLFWEYVRIRNVLKPTWFVLENVASMPKEDRDVITETMGVEPILINASLVSAQCRKRLFWTNIPNVGLPEDKGILLKDILQSNGEVEERFVVNGKSLCLTASYSKTSQAPKEKEVEHEAKKRQRTLVFHRTAQTGRNDTKKLGYVGEHDHQSKRVYDEEGKVPALNVVCNSMVKVGHIGTSDAQANRVYSTEGKSVTLSANGGGLGAKTGLYTEWSPAPYPVHVPGGASTETIRVGHEQRRKLKDGKRADDDPSIDAQRRIETRNDDKCGTLTTVLKDNHIVDVPTHRIRKLTPVECERLQCLPDGYTEGIAMTNRYKALGNAFCVDVVAHILRSIRK